MLDFKSRLPRTKKEKEHYRQVRDNWNTVYFPKKKKPPLGIVISICAVLLVTIPMIIGWIIMWQNDFVLDLTIPDEISKVDDNIVLPKLPIAPLKKLVGIQTSNYITAFKTLASEISSWQSETMNNIGNHTIGPAPPIENIMQAYEVLNDLEINKLSLLKDFETISKERFREITSKISEISQDYLITLDELIEMNTIVYRETTPFDYLKKLMEDGNFNYTIIFEDGVEKIQYKVSERAID